MYRYNNNSYEDRDAHKDKAEKYILQPDGR